MTFTAIDFEIATNHHICAVGIVTIKNRKIIDEFHSLIQPPDNKYNYYTIQVHGITPKDTKDAPRFEDIYPEIKKRLSGKMIVAHNESFDRSVLQKTMIDYKLDYSGLNIPEKWECTMKICRTSDKYPSGKLNECCAVDNIKLNHHEALSDARACALLYLKNL